MRNILKIISFWAIIFLISGTLFFVPKKINAQIPVGAQVVTDPAHTAATTGGWLDQAARFLLDNALKSALSILKKRLLDTLVDETVQWIQGGGTPKFVQDYKGAVGKVINDSAGEVAQEIGLADICKPFKLSLQIGMTTPPTFSKQISCTLDDMVGNINDFYGDFSKGGWIGYNELWKPQNNFLGAWILANDEMINLTNQNVKAQEQEIQSGQGFLSTKQCNEWTLYIENDMGDTEVFETKSTEEFPDPKPYAPSSHPPIPPNANDPGLGNYNPEWKCTNSSITTPGTSIANSLNKALGAHLDFIINAEDLKNYIAAIADAAINRLVQEGVRGLQNMTLSETTTGNPSTPPNLSNSTTEAGGNYASSSEEILNQTKKTYLRPINESLAALTNAQNDLTNASSSFSSFIVMLQTMIANCPAQINWATGELNAANSTAQDLTNKSNDVISLKLTLLQKQYDISTAVNSSQIIAAQIDSALITQAQNLKTDASNLLKTINTKVNDAAQHMAQCTTGP